jgi:hypothetical protein
VNFMRRKEALKFILRLFEQLAIFTLQGTDKYL